MDKIKIIRPKFRDGVLLTAERINALSQQSLGAIDILYKNWSDGIISGFQISVEDKNIILKKGIFKHKGKVFLFDEEVIVPYGPTDTVTYLKISLSDAIDKLGETTYYFDIVLNDEAPLEDEIELCRFRLQPSARLRYIYDGFDDMITQFNVINLIHCPYAAREKPTLHPAVLNRFAKELVKAGTNNQLDQAFCLQILSQDSVINLECICTYLEFRDDIEFERPTNTRVYNALNDIVLAANKGKVKKIEKKPFPRRMIIID